MRWQNLPMEDQGEAAQGGGAWEGCVATLGSVQRWGAMAARRPPVRRRSGGRCNSETAAAATYWRLGDTGGTVARASAGGDAAAGAPDGAGYRDGSRWRSLR